MKQVWYADDATGGGTLTEVRSWWDKLTLKGPGYGYHPKASKLWLLVKEARQEKKLKECSVEQEYGSPLKGRGFWEWL